MRVVSALPAKAVRSGRRRRPRLARIVLSIGRSINSGIVPKSNAGKDLAHHAARLPHCGRNLVTKAAFNRRQSKQRGKSIMTLARISSASSLLALAAAGAIAACAAPAAAADLGGPSYRPSVKDEYSYAPQPMPFWRGFYFGGNVGYGWDGGNNQTLATSDGAFSAGIENAGAFGGAQFGYNAQFGNIVVGVEADIQGGDVNGSRSFAAGLAAGTISTDIDYFGTIRGRLGYATGPFLIYATGGFAWANVDTQAVGVTTAGNAYNLSGSSFATGYVVGAGVEYAISRNWSAKMEYQYLNLDAGTFGGVDSGGQAVSTKVEPDLHTVRMGLNYRF